MIWFSGKSGCLRFYYLLLLDICCALSKRQIESTKKKWNEANEVEANNRNVGFLIWSTAGMASQWIWRNSNKKENGLASQNSNVIARCLPFSRIGFYHSWLIHCSEFSHSIIWTQMATEWEREWQRNEFPPKRSKSIAASGMATTFLAEVIAHGERFAILRIGLITYHFCFRWVATTHRRMTKIPWTIQWIESMSMNQSS